MKRKLPLGIIAKALSLTLSIIILVTGALFVKIPNQRARATDVNYTVQNGQVLRNGTPIQIRGINWFGFENPTYVAHGLWARNWKDMISQMKSLGFNAVRIPFCPQTLKNSMVTSIDYFQNEDLRNLNSLEVLDKFMNEFASQNMYVLLDHHRTDCTSITELWYTESYTESQWINDLAFIAGRYKNLNNLLGIDLKNEPFGSATWGSGNPATDWKMAAEKAGSAVLNANPNTLVFVEGIQNGSSCSSNIVAFWGENLESQKCRPIDSTKIPKDKLVLSPHIYGPDVNDQSYFNDPNFPNNMPAIWDSHFGDLAKQGYTIIPGEWGGKYGNGGLQKDVVWQNALVDYFKSRGICNTFYWDFNPNSTDTGGVLQDDWKTPWANKVSMLNNFNNSCNSGSSNTNNQIQTNSFTPTPIKSTTVNAQPNTSNPSTIKVYAAGTPLGGVYPTMELWIKDQKVQSWNNVKGDISSRSFEEKIFTANFGIDPSIVTVKFVNDDSNGLEDRNLIVDRINIDGIDYQSEDQSTLSQGSWNLETGCSQGYKKSEWLHCNGYLSYSSSSRATFTQIPNGSEIKIYAAGTSCNNVMPDMQVLINDSVAKTFSNISNATSEYSFTSPAKVSVDQVKIKFPNDCFANGQDRNLKVEKMVLDGVEYRTDSWKTYSEGAWDSGTGCTPGYKNTQWLNCPGYFKFSN